MEKALLFGGGVLVGAALSLLFCARAISYWHKKARAAQREKPRKVETAKLALWICLGMGIVWVWCSYILAWLDHQQIAESLSQAAVTEIIGVVLAYCIKATVENLSKNNHWPDKRPAEEKTAEPDSESDGDAKG